MDRLPNWESRLNLAIKEMRDKEFEYGVHDCALMAAALIEAMTGIDPAAEFRGGYEADTAPTAEEAVATYEVAADNAGLEELAHVDFARRGDLVLLELPGEDTPALGIVDMTGTHAVFPMVPKGIRRLRVRACARAWRV